MPIALGLDAGGTYTDAVLFDLDRNQLIASAKSPTTPPTYVEGVAGAIAGLPEQLRLQASYVALSTTLATNAIVEGRHAPAGLILIGYDRFETRGVHWEPKRVVPGRHTIRGIEIEAFDEARFRSALAELLTEGIAGIAISSVLSVRNPEHELRAAAIARDKTNLPVVCGHEVTGVLNALVRAETAALNAGLIPLLHRFVDAVERVLSLSNSGLRDVPCLMVTGDGCLMATAAARLRPVETILSGPTCSVLGAARLAGVKEGIVVDVGGTTTDIALLHDGRPGMAARGVSVGPWCAGVPSAHVLTRGLGGDSAVTVQLGAVRVGPRRVVPIASVAARCPRVAAAFAGLLERIRAGGNPGGDWRLTNPTDAFIRVQLDPPAALEDQEAAILGALEGGALTRLELSKAVRYPHLSLLRTERLERWGLIERAGLTPTDLWHVTGEYCPWDRETARAAAELVAMRLDTTVDDLILRVREQTTRMLTRQVTQAHLGIDDGHDGIADATFAGRLTRIVLGETPRDGLAASLSLQPPIIGVGAPAHLFLGSVAQRLGGRLVVPPGAPVASAVGAAIGAVAATSSALVRPQEDGTILCYGPEERRSFQTRREAVKWARQQVLPVVERELRHRGATASTIDLLIEHRGTEVRDVPDPIWWETEVRARGIGRPAVGRGLEDAPASSHVRVSERWATPGLKEAEEKLDDAESGQ